MHCTSTNPLELGSESTSAVLEAKTPSNDKTPSMEEKLQEVEKVKYCYEFYNSNCHIIQ